MTNRKLHSVLYVDDDPDICAVVQAALRLLAGLKVHIANSGEHGIDLAYELRPDLILMDVMMPRLDGPSTFRRMRENAMLAAIPVIFLTAKVLPSEIAHFFQLGAIGVIGKPFDPAKLCDDVLTLWNNRETVRGAARAHDGQFEAHAQEFHLAVSFLRRASDDVDHLRRILELARLGDHSRYIEAERVAHSLHGAAAMFGFPEVSTSGGVIERLLERARAGSATLGSIDDAGVLRQLLECTERLAQEVESAGQIAAVS
jgi:CheY-like chemotaxis protein